MPAPTDRELLTRLIEAIQPLAFSGADNPPPATQSAMRKMCDALPSAQH